MATVTDVENCYRYILGRDISPDERYGIDRDVVTERNLNDLRLDFLKSPEFHNSHLETLFENLIPQSIPVLYETSLGFKIYLDLRQLHISFGVLNGAYDRTEVELLRKIVPDDGLFVDVGGNCGYYSLAIAAKRNFIGRVIAFEPLMPLWELFEQSIAANGWSKRIDLRCMALGHSQGHLPLTDAEFSINAGATRLAVDTVNASGSRMVRVDTLDNVLAGDHPDAIKVDIEGAEGLFFHGACKTIEKGKPTLLFEMNPELLGIVSKLAPADVQRWLQNLRYRLWAVDDGGLKPVPVESNLGDMIGPSGMRNFLAVHLDRVASLCDRIGGEIRLNDHAPG